jgi:hypothetical protein
VFGNDYYGGRILAAHRDGTGTDTLATGRLGPGGIATDGVNLYWPEGLGDIGRGTIYRMPVGGGSISVVATGLSLSFFSYTYQVATDGVNVYFDALDDTRTHWALRKVPIGGGSVSNLFLAADTLSTSIPSWSLINGTIFFADRSGDIREVQGTSGTPGVVATATSFAATNFVLIGNTLYWSSGTTLFSAPASGGGSVTTTNAGAIALLGTDGVSLYAEMPTVGIVRFDRTTLTPTILAPGSLSLITLTVSGSDLLWVDDALRLLKLPK